MPRKAILGRTWTQGEDAAILMAYGAASFTYEQSVKLAKTLAARLKRSPNAVKQRVTYLRNHDRLAPVTEVPRNARLAESRSRRPMTSTQRFPFTGPPLARPAWFGDEAELRQRAVSGR